MLCKNICSCQATSYFACPLAAVQARSSHSWKQKAGHRSDLVGPPTPLFPPFPYIFVVVVVSADLSVPSRRSREESDQSSKLSWALGVGSSGSARLWEACCPRVAWSCTSSLVHDNESHSGDIGDTSFSTQRAKHDSGLFFWSTVWQTCSCCLGLHVFPPLLSPSPHTEAAEGPSQWSNKG